MSEQDTAVAVLQEKVKFLESQLCAIQVDVRDKFDRLEVKLDMALKAIQSDRRPTWSVAGALTLLTTVCTGLIVYVVTR